MTFWQLAWNKNKIERLYIGKRMTHIFASSYFTFHLHHPLVFLLVLVRRWALKITLFENYPKMSHFNFGIFRLSKTRQNGPFLPFLINFVHPNCKRSSLRSQYWDIFLWFSNTVRGEVAYRVRKSEKLMGSCLKRKFLFPLEWSKLK